MKVVQFSVADPHRVYTEVSPQRNIWEIT